MIKSKYMRLSRFWRIWLNLGFLIMWLNSCCILMRRAVWLESKMERNKLIIYPSWGLGDRLISRMPGSVMSIASFKVWLMEIMMIWRIWMMILMKMKRLLIRRTARRWTMRLVVVWQAWLGCLGCLRKSPGDRALHLIKRVIWLANEIHFIIMELKMKNKKLTIKFLGLGDLRVGN